MHIIKNCLGQSHELAEKFVKAGDNVVDATAGNGHDTIFLAKLVGENGRVFSFDVQSKAIAKTREKLIKEGMTDRVMLINDGHQDMDKYVEGEVSTVMFNLGYLPGGDHNICTRFETTCAAIEKAMNLLKLNGAVILVVYYGGDSGFEEKDALMSYIERIDNKRYSVFKSQFVNQPNCPPILVCIEKVCEII